MRFTSWGGKTQAFGPMACVRTYEDATPVRAQLDTPGLGRILVVDGGGSRRVALLGDKMATIGMKNGWQGVLIHGAVRDVDALAGLDFAVFALDRVPLRARHAGDSESDTVLCFGHTIFTPGHWVAMDSDGVVVTASSHAV